jgi:hypothetical protein
MSFFSNLLPNNGKNRRKMLRRHYVAPSEKRYIPYSKGVIFLARLGFGLL